MKKVYKFNLIPGVEFVEKDGFCYAASDDPIWPKSHLTKVIIDGLLKYEENNRTLYRELTFAKKTIGDRDKTIKEKDKEIRTHKNANSHLNNQIEYIKKCAENEIDHRNKLIDEKDKEIEYLRCKLREEILKSEAYKEANKTLKEENSNLINLIAQSPVAKGPIPLSSAEDCSDFYICTPDHITYGYIAGEFGIGLYVDDTLILLKGDKASEVVRERSSMTDRINTLETTLKKKDETIKKLRNTTEFANGICDGYGALTDALMTSIEAKNSEIKVLSDQVTRLMDQLKEVMGDDTEFEQRVGTETKPKTNFDKVMHDMYQKLSPARLASMIKSYDCEGVSCDDCLFSKTIGYGDFALCDMSTEALTEWLSEDIKED